MSRKAFSIHSDFYEELSSLDPTDRGDVVLALVAWASDKRMPELNPACAMLFRLMTAQIERLSTKNASNGAKGGKSVKPSEESETSEESEESEGGKNKPPITVTITNTNTVSDTVESTVDADAPPHTQKSRKFQKPTPEQVAEYCRERKNSVDAQRFIDYYEANGWRVGKNPMKDWMAAVRTWERSGVANQPRGQPQAITTNPFVNLYRKEHGDESG